MDIAIQSLFEHSAFKNLIILAGKNGLNRRIKRVSVYDSPVKEFLFNTEYLLPGDFFLSSLDHFVDTPASIIDLVKLLHTSGCSGLMIMEESKAIIPGNAISY